MYARVTSFKVDPARLPELSAKVGEMAPRAKALPGMIDAYVAWRADGQGVVVAVYESKEAADRAVQRIQALWGNLASLVSSAPRTDAYENAEHLTG
jgi:6-phosphogluconolactonase (cycloisomerase 2 family)